MANKKLSSKCFYCIGDWTAKTTPERNLFPKDETKENNVPKDETKENNVPKDETKKSSVPGNYFFLYFNQVSNFQCSPYLPKKIPQEHSILNIRKRSVVVSV